MYANGNMSTSLGRPEDMAVYARYSSDDQNPTSIDDQVQRCLGHAQRVDGCQPAHVFADEAESVKDRTAPNWDRLLDQVRAGKIRRVYVDELSRITRDVRHLLHVQAVFRHRNASLVSTLEAIDIAADQADIHVLFSGYKNAAATRDARHRVKRGMDGNLRRRLSTGDITFGYTSQVLTAAEVNRLGLPPRPEDKPPYKKLVINDEEAAIVRKMHHWFAVEKVSIRRITQRLNELGVGRGGKAKSRIWLQIHVRKILKSRRFLGHRWRNETMVVRDPDTRRREIKAQPPGERIEIYDPTLAIIDEATYEATCQRFAEIHKTHPAGTKGWKGRPGSYRDYAPKHLLSGTLVCGVCGTPLSQMSSGYYGCPRAPLNACANRAGANRVLTEQLILEAIMAEVGEHVVMDLVYDLLRHEVASATDGLPAEIARLQSQLAQVNRELQRLADAVATAGDLATLTSAIKRREEQRAALERDLRQAQERAAVSPQSPTRDWFGRQLSTHLAKLLAEKPARAAGLLQQITGPIAVYPEVKPWLRKPHLVARFQVDFAAACAAAANASDEKTTAPSTAGFGTYLEVPLRKMPFYERFGSEVVRMHDDEGLAFAEIARRLPDNVTAEGVKIAYNFGKHGTPDPGDSGWRNHCRRRNALSARRSDANPSLN